MVANLITNHRKSLQSSFKRATQAATPDAASSYYISGSWMTITHINILGRSLEWNLPLVEEVCLATVNASTVEALTTTVLL